MFKHYNLFTVTNDFKQDALTDFLQGISLRPNGFGHQHSDPDSSCPERISGDYEIYYIIGGESEIQIGEENLYCVPGDFVCIPPFVKNRIYSPSHNLHDNFWIHFDIYPLYKSKTFMNILTKGNYKQHIAIRDEMVMLFNLLESEMIDQQPGAFLFLNSVLLQILTLVMRLNIRNENDISILNNTESSYSEMHITDMCIEYIHKHIKEKICIADICKSLHISEPYLFKIFANTMKTTPQHYIMLCKVKEAELLFRFTSMSVNEVANELSFNSPFYLSSVFKKYYKMSPKYYKNNLGCKMFYNVISN